jgi:hypothetical protein
VIRKIDVPLIFGISPAPPTVIDNRAADNRAAPAKTAD